MRDHDEEVIAEGNPYKVVNRGGDFLVVKAHSGKVVPGGRHPTRKQALAHFRALEANVHK